MVMLNDKTVEIYSAIRSVLGNFYTKTLQDVVKNRGLDLDAKINSDVRDALSYMRDVSEHPEKYFSRLATEEDWMWRAEAYRKSKNSPLVNAYGSRHIVDDPADVVYNKVLPCLMDERIAQSYRDFCKLVMNWEYSRTDVDYHAKRVSMNQQDQILEKSRQISVENNHWFDNSINALYGGKCR